MEYGLGVNCFLGRCTFSEKEKTGLEVCRREAQTRCKSVRNRRILSGAPRSRIGRETLFSCKRFEIRHEEKKNVMIARGQKSGKARCA